MASSIAIIIASICLFFTVNGVFTKNSPQAPFQLQDLVSCAPSASGESVTDENGKFIPVLPGWGKYAYRISTSNDSAQFYFNQGLNLYYSYHLKQALASFREAARFDETCAMAYWGQALSMGPFYNDPVYRMNKQVPGIISLMTRYSSGASDKEKAMISAMQKRYSEDSTNSDRNVLDNSYAQAMFSLIRTFSADNDIKALYIDAVMLQHKWDFWANNGTAKPWTPELVKLCEEITAGEPLHPAALHYYIHVTEASRHPELALKSATLLKDALPGTSHMVHMASHMYQRNGLFAEGVYVNEEANKVSNTADSLSPVTGNGQNTTIHYFAVQSYCALSAGMYHKAMPVYMRARNRAVDLSGPLDNLPYSQFVYMMPEIAAVRMGQWQDVLAAVPVNPKWTYAFVMQNFTKGMAYTRRKDIKAAEACLAAINENINDHSLDVRRGPFNKPVQTCRIAAGILKGEILAATGNTKSAIDAFKSAIEEEDNLVYSEPQDWLIPARQYLGNLFINLKMPVEAEKVYQEDLVWHPGNGYSLVGLYRASLAQNKKKAAEAYRNASNKVFHAADVVPTASVF